MTKAALKGMLGRKLRTTLTAIAIVLGVAMVCGSFVVTDTMLKASDQLKQASYGGAAAVVTGRTAFSSENNGGSSVRPVPEALVQKVRGVSGVASAHGEITDEDIARYDAEAKQICEDAWQFADKSPEPPLEALAEDVLVDTTTDALVSD